MTKRNKRIRQIAGSIFAVLSLVVASVAACTCAHHEPVTETKSSCHETGHHDKNSPNIGAPSIAETCFCVPPGNDLSVKAESFKLKKLGALPTTGVRLDRITYSLIAVVSDFPINKFRHGRVGDPSVPSRGPPLL